MVSLQFEKLNHFQIWHCTKTYIVYGLVWLVWSVLPIVLLTTVDIVWLSFCCRDSAKPCTGDCKMYATEKQSRGSDCSLIVVSLTTENNRIIHIRKAVAFSDFTFLLQTFCNLL